MSTEAKLFRPQFGRDAVVGTGRDLGGTSWIGGTAPCVWCMCFTQVCLMRGPSLVVTTELLLRAPQVGSLSWQGRLTADRTSGTESTMQLAN
jgi:hypothetical protein